MLHHTGKGDAFQSFTGRVCTIQTPNASGLTVQAHNVQKIDVRHCWKISQRFPGPLARFILGIGKDTLESQRRKWN